MTRVLLAENGDLIRFDEDGGRVADKVPAGRILIDGTRSGEVGDEVLRDRRHLAGDGLVVPVVAIGRQSGTLEETPDVITRGFVLDARTEALLKEIPSLLAAAIEGASVEERTDPGLIKEKIRVDLQRFFRKRSGLRPLVLPVDHGDLTWPDQRSPAVSARSSASALFALSLIWLIALASYSAADPVWFFNTGAGPPAGEFRRTHRRVPRRVVVPAARLCRLSRLPIVMVVIGWHYFWCRVLDAPYTKALGAALLFCCIAAFLSLAFGRARRRRQGVPRRRLRSASALAGVLAEYLNRTGSIILILTLLFLAIILSTQFSFGRLFAAVGMMLASSARAAIAAIRARRDERQREKQRQEVLKKHLDKRPAKASQRSPRR